MKITYNINTNALIILLLLLILLWWLQRQPDNPDDHQAKTMPPALKFPYLEEVERAS